MQHPALAGDEFSSITLKLFWIKLCTQHQAALCCKFTGVDARRWNADGGQLSPEATFEGHTDWVNDVALVGSDVLASASADHAVRLWKANSYGEVSQ